MLLSVVTGAPPLPPCPALGKRGEAHRGSEHQAVADCSEQPARGGGRARVEAGCERGVVWATR